MTLNLTIASPSAAYQASDFRLSEVSATGGYTTMEVKGHKQVLAMGKGWHASVSFTGIAKAPSVGVTNVDQWLAQGMAKLGSFGDYSLLLDFLLSATNWLYKIRQTHRSHTFTVVGFAGPQVFVDVISNYQNGRGLYYEARDQLEVFSLRPSQPQVIVTGVERAVTRADRKLLRSQVRHRKTMQEIIETVVRVNQRASVHKESRNLISPECLVTSLRPNGRTYSRAFGLDDSQPYMPPSVFGNVEVDIKAIFKEAGLAGEPRLLERMTVASWGTPEADADEATDFT